MSFFTFLVCDISDSAKNFLNVLVYVETLRQYWIWFTDLFRLTSSLNTLGCAYEPRTFKESRTSTRHTPMVFKSKSSKVKLLITNNTFCIVQRATAQSKTGFFRHYGVAEAPTGFQAGWSDCMYFSLSFCSFCLLIWSFRVSFCTHEVTLPYWSSA
jgi:hypothetical protein